MLPLIMPVFAVNRPEMLQNKYPRQKVLTRFEVVLYMYDTNMCHSYIPIETISYRRVRTFGCTIIFNCYITSSTVTYRIFRSCPVDLVIGDSLCQPLMALVTVQFVRAFYR